MNGKNQLNCEWSHDIPDLLRKRNEKPSNYIFQNSKTSKPNTINTSSKSYETTNSQIDLQVQNETKSKSSKQ